VPDPEPGLGEVRVKVRCCGICRTDLHVIEGELPPQRPAVIPGHQVVGVVAARGAAVTRFAVGERVGIAWLRETCGTCRYCRTGKENLCPEARFTGYHEHGGYAEYAVVRAAFAYAVPSALAPAAATPLLCAGIIGFRALRRAEVRPGCRLGLYGFGASAHIAIQVARHWGCTVYVMTRDERHQVLARELGAAWAGGAADRPPDRLDSAILFAPAGELVPAALRAVDRGGTVVCAGIHMSDVPSFPYRILWEERVVRSVANLTRRDGEEFLALAPRVPVRTEVETFPLEAASEALERLRGGRLRGAAVLVVG
jgi:propanol-preferring alcohol dehydrogenase